MLQNHPVHILNKNQKFSRSSLIPFCSFGDELIGSEIYGFDIKVCNIFKPKLYYDQLCYETDLQNLNDNSHVNLMNQLNLGLTLVIDYNEERQINAHNSKNGSISNKKKFSFLDNGNSLSMYLNTISIILINTYIRYRVFFLTIYIRNWGVTALFWNLRGSLRHPCDPRLGANYFQVRNTLYIVRIKTCKIAVSQMEEFHSLVFWACSTGCSKIGSCL